MSDIHTSIKLPSSPENVSQVESLVNQVAEQYKIGPDVQGNILLSLTEAVVNAMVHGNCNDDSKSVSISLHKRRDVLAIRVSDEGMGFDPQNVPDPTSPERIDVCGGRGIFLMRCLSDACRFSRGGATVEMKFRI